MFLWGMWSVDRVRTEWLDECWHCLLGHIYSLPHTHIQFLLAHRFVLLLKTLLCVY